MRVIMSEILAFIIAAWVVKDMLKIIVNGVIMSEILPFIVAAYKPSPCTFTIL